MAPENDVILLQEMIARDRESTRGSLSDSQHEVYFVARNYLKHLRPSHEEILGGIVDGERDCGIDAIYTLANGFFLSDDAEIANLGKRVNLELVIIQSKNTRGFGEDAIDKLIVSLPKLLDFSRDETELAASVNTPLLERTRRFLQAYRSLDLPNLTISVAFASLKATQVHPNVEIKGNELDGTITRCFGGSTVDIGFLTAALVADYARQADTISRKIPLSENPISTDKAGGYIGVVSLGNYFDFITDDANNLDSALFEANVRDYEGTTPVNESISQSLDSAEGSIDFWWLNNGITVVAERVQLANKLLELESPQIVNGLQTSHEVYKLGQRAEIGSDSRSLLVKIIQASDDNVRDRIIRATNSQTTLGPSALRATDRVQRQIEEILLSRSLYYERRKNQHLNRGAPLSNIVSINDMGQALLSVVAQTPHIARGEISRIYENSIYDHMFSPAHPIGLYPAAIEISRLCKEFLRSNPSTSAFSEDFAYHLMTLVSMVATRRFQPRAQEIASALEHLDEVDLDVLLSIVRDEFGKYASRNGSVLFDQVAKSPDLTDSLLRRGKQLIRSTESRRR